MKHGSHIDRRLLVCCVVACCSLVAANCRPPHEASPEDGAEGTVEPADSTPGPGDPPTPGSDVMKRSAPAVVWNTYHGAATLDGVADIRLPDKLELRWRFKAGAPVRTTPVGEAGRVFFTNAKGQVFRVDGDGIEVWSRTLTRAADDGQPLEEVLDAPPAYFDTTVMVGSADGIVYALEAATGADRWTADLDGTILGSAGYYATQDREHASVMVIEQGSGMLHCLDFRTGQHRWRADGVDRCDGPPSVGNGVVVFGSCAAALHVFSADDGRLLRQIEIDPDSQVASGVALAGDSVFSGSRSGKVLCANTESGAIRWTNEDSDDEVFTTPAVNSEWVVVGSADGNVYALDRAGGERRWAFTTQGSPSSPVIAGDKVLVSSGGTLFLLRLADGGMTWSHEVSDAITSPAVVGDLVIVGSDDGTVSAFGPMR